MYTSEGDETRTRLGTPPEEVRRRLVCIHVPRVDHEVPRNVLCGQQGTSRNRFTASSRSRLYKACARYESMDSKVPECCNVATCWIIADLLASQSVWTGQHSFRPRGLHLRCVHRLDRRRQLHPCRSLTGFSMYCVGGVSSFRCQRQASGACLRVSFPPTRHSVHAAVGM